MAVTNDFIIGRNLPKPGTIAGIFAQWTHKVREMNPDESSRSEHSRIIIKLESPRIF